MMRCQFFLLCVLGWLASVSALAMGAGQAGPERRDNGADRHLATLAAQPLPLGSIRPAGWLRQQLLIQAKGLSGHLDEFWPDVADSSWIGGKAEGWERGPYWLDGFIPLAIELNDSTLKAKSQKWVDYILDTQREDGWIGPLKGNPDPSSRLSQFDVWPRYIVLKALSQWQEATGDERIIPAMSRYLRRLDALLDEQPLAEWARVRWADLALSIYWLYDRTHEPWLLDLAAKVRKQGLDWPKLARNFPYREKVTRAQLEQFRDAAGGTWINDQFGATHGVNIAMGVKAPGVWSRQSDDAGDRQAVLTLLDTLDRHHGQATGMFSCDEHLAGRHPSQGTELCAVVELMYSLETLLTIMPEVAVADRLELVAFNALPATFKDDMWAHQYDQQANQVICKVSPERIYSNNGPDANLFGLEPNFGCCLANMHQGWPKFVSHLWMTSPSGGLIAMAYAPCQIKTRVGNSDVQINVRTEYPFADTVAITINCSAAAQFPLDLCIPGWADGATVSVDGAAAKPARAGTFHRISRQWTGENEVTLTLPLKLRAERRFNDSVTIRRGPLVFALEVGQDWRKLRGQDPHADWEVHPTTPWNYALMLNPDFPESSLRAEMRESADAPFSSEAPAVRLVGQGRRVPGWELAKSAADAPPKSPVSSSEPLEQITLIPYGSAKLRVTEIPVLRRD
jgi:DUF1680 family protein